MNQKVRRRSGRPLLVPFAGWLALLVLFPSIAISVLVVLLVVEVINR